MKIAVVTGGNSGEYEISLKSGNNIAQQLDKYRYDVFLIHLREQNWTYTNEKGEIYNIDKNDFSLCIDNQKINFDCVFIAIHGTPGEDGKLQGYFDMMNIPYTSCNSTISALTFNVSITYFDSLRQVIENEFGAYEDCKATVPKELIADTGTYQQRW